MHLSLSCHGGKSQPLCFWPGPWAPFEWFVNWYEPRTAFVPALRCRAPAEYFDKGGTMPGDKLVLLTPTINSEFLTFADELGRQKGRFQKVIDLEKAKYQSPVILHVRGSFNGIHNIVFKKVARLKAFDSRLRYTDEPKTAGATPIRVNV